MAGGKGDDVYLVDSSGDLVIENAGEGSDLVRSGVSYTLSANVENLELIWSSWVNGTGNALANKITGNSGNNVLSGLDGNDILDGGAGNDTLDGGNGNDTLVGGLGNDVLMGGSGADTMTGGSGNDTFVFKALSDSTVAAPDTITDYAKGDKLDLSAIDANTKVAGDQAFTMVGSFTGHAGEASLKYNTATGYTTLSVDVDGDKVADMAVLLNGNVTSSAGWVL